MRTMSHLTRGIGHFDPDRLSTSFVARVCCGPLGRVRSYQLRPFYIRYIYCQELSVSIPIPYTAENARRGEKSDGDTRDVDGR